MKNTGKKMAALLMAVCLVLSGGLPVYASEADKSSTPPSKSSSKSTSKAEAGRSSKAENAAAVYGKNPNDDHANITDDANYIYRIISFGGETTSYGIERISKADKSSKVTCIPESMPKDLNVSADYLYFNTCTPIVGNKPMTGSGVYCMQKDGTERKK